MIDARRGANMFRKINVPLLGIVENMSHYECPACGHKEHIFGEEGALRTAEAMKMDVLGQVRWYSFSSSLCYQSVCNSWECIYTNSRILFSTSRYFDKACAHKT